MLTGPQATLTAIATDKIASAGAPLVNPWPNTVMNVGANTAVVTTIGRDMTQSQRVLVL